MSNAVKTLSVILIAVMFMMMSSCSDSSGGNDEHFKVRPGQKELYDEGIKNGKAMMVLYTSPGCGACRQLAPTMAQLENEWKDKVTFVVFNVSDSKYSEIAGKEGIRAIPTMHFYKDGKKSGQVVGSMPKADLEKEFVKITK